MITLFFVFFNLRSQHHAFTCQCKVELNVVECPRDKLDQFHHPDTSFSFSFFQSNKTRVLGKLKVHCPVNMVKHLLILICS